MTDRYTQNLGFLQAVVGAIAPDLDVMPDSVCYNLLQATASLAVDVQYSQTNATNAAYSSTATGANLAQLAADAGLKPLLASAASGTVTFTAGASGATVPATVRVWTNASLGGAPIYFSLAAQVVVPASGTATGAVTCTTPGALGNVVAGAIAYNDPVQGIIGVTNLAACTGGADAETDTALRTRLAATRTVLYSAAAVQAAALTVPGCAYASLDDPHDGSGHTTLYAAAQDGTLASPLQALVQTAVDAVLPLTATNTVAAFTLVRAVFQDSIAVQAGYTANVVAAAVADAIAAYVLTLGAGQTRQPGPMWAAVTANVAGLADWYSTSSLPTVGGTSLLRLLAAPASPVLGTGATGGALSDGTVYCQITWDTAAGETLPSIETSVVLAGGTSTQTVTVAIPAFPDASVTQANVYLSASVGGERLQGDFATSSGGTYTQTGALATGSAAAPASNTISAATVTVVAA